MAKIVPRKDTGIPMATQKATRILRNMVNASRTSINPISPLLINRFSLLSTASARLPQVAM